MTMRDEKFKSSADRFASESMREACARPFSTSSLKPTIDGGLAGTRTLDQCLKRALLYQLSYQPTNRGPGSVLLGIQTGAEILNQAPRKLVYTPTRRKIFPGARNRSKFGVSIRDRRAIHAPLNCASPKSRQHP